MSINDLCISFEKNLKWKLNQKAKSSADEFRILMNTFRYYDPNNSDEINKEQWIKAIKKIGLYLSEEKLNNLFQCYANQNSNINNGMEVINYKDFVYNLLYNSINQPILFKKSNIFVRNNNSIKNINYNYDFKTKKNRDYLEEKNIYNYRINVNINNDPNLKSDENEENKINNNLLLNNNIYNIKDIKIKNNDFNTINIKYFIKNVIDIFRAKINKDNGVTYYNLLKNIKLHTSFNQNTNISLSKLNFILRESNLFFTIKELQSLFCIIDFNDTGFISINKFLKAIRGNLNYFRTNVLTNIFKTQIDINKTGQISIYYFKRLYQAKNHPDVINKKMTQNEVMTQFNYTFDIFCKLNKINGDINCSQFIEYYEGISPSIPNDIHFKEIINNVWIRTNDFEQTYFPTINNQNINFNLEKKISRSISSPLMAFNNNSNKFNTLGNQIRNNYHMNPENNNYYNNNLLNNNFLNFKNGSLNNSINNNRISLKKVNLTPINNIPKINNSFYQFNNSNLNKSTNISSIHNKYSPIKNNHSQIICHDTISEEANKDKYNYSQIILNSLRNILIKRGNKSIFYLQRMLTNCDNDHTGKISFSDLNNIFRAYNFNIYFYDIKILFDLFDKNKVGVIQYDDLIKSIVGNMNDKRKELVIKIGYVNIKKMKCRFNSYKHPDVIKGNKTHEEAYGDFLECIQIYKEYICNINKNDNDFFNLNEFFQFFNEISMYIVDDSDFDLLIFGCWDIK